MDELPIDPEVVERGRRDRLVVAAISLGAMPGAATRYGLSRAIASPAGTFPWATFWTNVSGSLVLGFLLVLLVERYPSDRYVRPFAATGFLGAYTTFSTFSVEADLLVKDGHAAIAFTYVLASLVVGLAAVVAGVVTARAWRTS
jgi:CrcB protein